MLLPQVWLCPSSGVEVRVQLPFIEFSGEHRTAGQQAGWQALTLLVTVLLGLLSGFLAGLVVRCCPSPLVSLSPGTPAGRGPPSQWRPGIYHPPTIILTLTLTPRYDGTCFLDTPGPGTRLRAPPVEAQALSKGSSEAV